MSSLHFVRPLCCKVCKKACPPPPFSSVVGVHRIESSNPAGKEVPCCRQVRLPESVCEREGRERREGGREGSSSFGVVVVVVTISSFFVFSTKGSPVYKREKRISGGG